MTTEQKMRNILKAHFTIQKLEIHDDSDLHASHAEAKKRGGGHFSILISSLDFKGKTSLERHRMVYKALENELKSSIHALKIEARTPEGN